jgi:ribosomal protein L37E
VEEILPTLLMLLVIVGLVGPVWWAVRHDRGLKEGGPESDKAMPSEGGATCPRCGRISDVTGMACSYCGAPVDHGIRGRGY